MGTGLLFSFRIYRRYRFNGTGSYPYIGTGQRTFEMKIPDEIYENLRGVIIDK